MILVYVRGCGGCLLGTAPASLRSGGTPGQMAKHGLASHTPHPPPHSPPHMVLLHALHLLPSVAAPHTQHHHLPPHPTARASHHTHHRQGIYVYKRLDVAYLLCDRISGTAFKCPHKRLKLICICVLWGFNPRYFFQRHKDLALQIFPI